MSDHIQLAVTGAPLPPDFSGTPQEFFEAMLERMAVIFPTGQTSFTISGTEPSTNLGPWLKDGTQWYVWNEDTKRYVPLDISPSMKLVEISETAPVDGTRPLWLQIKGSRVVRWNLWLSGAWQPLASRGTTAQRPTDPVEYERFEDTTIRAEIVFYDAAWHTLSGVPGDIKFVSWSTLEEALQFNPGWQEFGEFFSNPNVRGRALVPAHKDPGGSPVASYTPGLGITARATGDKYGNETHVLTSAEAAKAPHQHLLGKRKDPGANDLDTQLIDSRTFSSSIAGTGKYEVLGDGTGAGTLAGDLTDGDLITSDPVTVASPAANDAHNNLGPRMSVWCLVKL